MYFSLVTLRCASIKAQQIEGQTQPELRYNRQERKTAKSVGKGVTVMKEDGFKVRKESQKVMTVKK